MSYISSSSSSSSSSSQLQSTLLLSYSLSGKLHPITENPFEELYEQGQSKLAEDDQDTSYSDSESDSEESFSSSTTSHNGTTVYSNRLPQATIPRPKTLLLHAAHSQQHAQSPPSSWRFPRISPSQNYALSVLRYAYALSSLTQNVGEGKGTRRDVIWSSGTRWY